MKAKIFSLLTIVFCLLLVFSGVTFGSNQYKLNEYDENIILTEVNNYTYEFLNEGFSPYYYISDFKCDITDFEVANKEIEAYMYVEMTTLLKAESVEELPMIKGMLDAVGLSKFESEEKALTDIKSANNVSDTKAETAAYLVSEMIKETAEYIGEKQVNTFVFKLVGNIDNYDLKVNSLMVEQGKNNFEDAKIIIPENPEKLYDIGLNTFWQVVENKNININRSYDRLAARDYANTWVGTNVTSCYMHGTSCGVLQAPSYYNTNQYSTYYLHNDCANYVSQAIHAGGIQTNSTWCPYTSAWINVNQLKNYLTSNNLVNDTGYYWAAAGGIIMMSNDGSSYYHTVVIVLNDTVTRKFSGHTNDRYRANYGNNSNWKYYTFN